MTPNDNKKIPQKRDLRDPDPLHKPKFKNVSGLIMKILWLVIIFIPALLYNLFNIIVRQRKKIRGQVVLVTGSGRGLGRGLALEMSQLGAFVVCVDINQKNNEETVQLIREKGGRAEGYTVNVANRKEVIEMVKKVDNAHGGVDILVNNAGLVMGVTIEDWAQDELEASYNVNVFSQYWTISACLETMRERNRGQIVTISSMSAIYPSQYLTIYGSTKAAIAALATSLRDELELNENNNIKVTTIYPFFINTSADYLDMYDISFPTMNMSEALRIIMDAILYEECDVTIPRHLYFLSYFSKLLPRYLQKLMLKLPDAEGKPPSKATRESLPYYDIVNASRFTKDKTT